MARPTYRIQHLTVGGCGTTARDLPDLPTTKALADSLQAESNAQGYHQSFAIYRSHGNSGPVYETWVGDPPFHRTVDEGQVLFVGSDGMHAGWGIHRLYRPTPRDIQGCARWMVGPFFAYPAAIDCLVNEVYQIDWKTWTANWTRDRGFRNRSDLPLFGAITPDMLLATALELRPHEQPWWEGHRYVPTAQDFAWMVADYYFLPLDDPRIIELTAVLERMA